MRLVWGHQHTYLQIYRLQKTTLLLLWYWQLSTAPMTHCVESRVRLLPGYIYSQQSEFSLWGNKVIVNLFSCEVPCNVTRPVVLIPYLVASIWDTLFCCQFACWLLITRCCTICQCFQVILFCSIALIFISSKNQFIVIRFSLNYFWYNKTQYCIADASVQ